MVWLQKKVSNGSQCFKNEKKLYKQKLLQPLTTKLYLKRTEN